MARPKTDFRNEVKTRVRDATYDALQQYMRDNRCASEARAISELLELALFGVVGTVPPTLDYLGLLVLSAAYGVSHPVVAAAARVPNVGICGPETPGLDDAGA